MSTPLGPRLLCHKVAYHRKCSYHRNVDCLEKDSWTEKAIYTFLIPLILLWVTALPAVTVRASFYGNLRLLPLDKANDTMGTIPLIL